MYKTKRKEDIKLKGIGKIKGLEIKSKDSKTIITDQVLIDSYSKKMLEKRMKKVYKTIFEFLTGEDDTSSGIKECLSEIEKVKSILFNKYKEKISIELYKEYITKIALTENEFKNKYMEREYFDKIINNMYRFNPYIEEEKIGKSR